MSLPNVDVSLLVSSVQDFCHKHLLPHVRKWDAEAAMPRELFTTLGAMGLMGVMVPASYGGSGLNYQAYTSVVEEMAKTDPSVALSVAAHNSLCTGHILSFGTEEQKQHFLPKLASGEHVGAWALTEPSTGSDAGNMKTWARRRGTKWVLNGTKNFITHGQTGDVVVVVARTGKESSSCFIVARGNPGLKAGKKEDKLGMRASETAEVILDNCEVPQEHLVGHEGEGFKQCLKLLDGGRVSIAALSVGIAQGAYESALQYAKERRQFGQPIGHFQGIGFKLSDMHMEIEAARLLLRKAADMRDRGQGTTKMSAMAKYFASEVCVRVATEAVQILGGYGYTKDFPVEKFYRDAKLCTIGEGTSEMQKLVIAKRLQVS